MQKVCEERFEQFGCINKASTVKIMTLSRLSELKNIKNFLNVFL
jgi:hypothetical protein